jgi:hypothetical protein
VSTRREPPSLPLAPITDYAHRKDDRRWPGVPVHIRQFLALTAGGYGAERVCLDQGVGGPMLP